MNIYKKLQRWYKVRNGTWLDHVENELQKQFNIFVEMLPKQFQESSDNLYIAGGCIWSIYHGEKVWDYDLFSSQAQYSNAIVRYIKDNMTVTFIEEPFVDSGYSTMIRGIWDNHNIIITPNAISIDKFQIITKWTGKSDDVVGQFDFMHNLNYFHNDKLTLLHGEKYLNNPYLNYNSDRARDMVSTIMRLPKFQKKGFIITRSVIAKILSRLEQTGFTDDDKKVMMNILHY